MTKRAIESQQTAKAMIDHYMKLGAAVVEERNAAERLRKAVIPSSRAHQRQGLFPGRRAWKPVE